MIKTDNQKGKKLLIAGIVIFIIGSGPLLVTMFLNPNSNPVGFGIMAYFTFWPAIVLMIVGLVKIFKAKKS